MVNVYTQQQFSATLMIPNTIYMNSQYDNITWHDSVVQNDVSVSVADYNPKLQNIY
jgi:hypothetical protein